MFIPLGNLIHVSSRDEVAQSIHSGHSAGLVLTLPLGHCVTFGKFLKLSEPSSFSIKWEKNTPVS